MSLRNVATAIAAFLFVLTVTEITNAVLANSARQREEDRWNWQHEWDERTLGSLIEIADAKESKLLDAEKAKLLEERKQDATTAANR